MNRPPGVSEGQAALSLVHHHPGRVRVRAAAFQTGDTAGRVLAALEAFDGVKLVEHTARTGSVLVDYEPGSVNPEALLEAIAGASGLALPDDDLATRIREPAVVAIDLMREMNEIVGELTGYRTDLRSIVPVGMLGLAAYSWLSHPQERLPRWDNLVYWSYNIFTQLHRREIENAAARAGVDDPLGNDS